MNRNNLNTYKGKMYSGKKYEAQGVIEGEASVLEILESFQNTEFYKLDYQDYQKFSKEGNWNKYREYFWEQKHIVEKTQSDYYNGIYNFYVIDESGHIKLLTFLHKYDLPQLSYPNENIPKNLCGLEELEVLDLRDNWVSEFPKEITNLKKLKYLNLYGNFIEEIPNHLSELES
ncbi:MAG: hypothetical protein GF311_08455, partial [Candidatus Lokiarchaeota archaeon]|nr:hypothetical protein [Candidatus Lokiarchaeota archaeon]